MRKFKVPFYLALLGAFSFIIIGSSILYITFSSVGEQKRLVDKANLILDTTDNLKLSLTKLEKSQKGFLLTESSSYDNDYQYFHSEVWKYFRELNDLLDNSDSVRKLNDLKELITRKMNLMDSMMSYTRSSDQRIDKDFRGFVKSRNFSTEITQILDSIESRQFELRKVEQQQYYSNRNIFNIILFLYAFIGCGLSLIMLYRTFRGLYEQENQKLIKEKEAQIKGLESELGLILTKDVTINRGAKEVLNFLHQKLPIVASKMFLSTPSGTLSLVGVHGVKISKEDFNISVKKESLLGDITNRDRVIQFTEIPEDYWTFESSLGSGIPKVLVFLPFAFQGRNIGTIEMAFFEKLDENQLELLHALCETIGVGMASAQSRSRVQELLEETQAQTEELQAQQEELRTSNEELEQQTRALEAQQLDLNYKNTELMNIKKNLEVKASELEKASKYKSEFLANMSHELRTPLNGLMILSSLLKENKPGNLTEQQLEFAASIHNAGADLLTLINDILDLSKIEARKITVKPEPFSIKSFVSQIDQFFKPHFTTNDLQWLIHIDEEAENLAVNTDRQRLKQIIKNFISNALKFTEKGQISFNVEYDPKKSEVLFSVIDTGIGIDEDKKELIFEAFEQEDTSISRKFGGTGLGLAISKELATLLGGRITVESTKDVGSTFTLILPANFKSKELSVSFEEKSELEKREPIAFEHTSKKARKKIHESRVFSLIENLDKNKKNILIVEDDEKFRKSVCHAVREANFEPIQAEDGELALAILDEFVPDAILLDIKIPKFSGLALLEHIKNSSRLRHIPVHMISAIDYQHSALKMGALGYLTKPVTMEKVSAAIERIERMLAEKMRKVLLVEDDKAQQMAISQLISGEDVELQVVSKGTEAIDLIKQINFDCIILDLNLPDIPGITFLKEINELDISLPPVVIYTAKDLGPDEENALKQFSESIILKGVRSPERLLDEVNLFLHRIETMLPEDKRLMLQDVRSGGHSFDGNHILLVDDDIRNVFALTSALENKGLSVTVARNGIEALKKLDENPLMDLVLMDIMMPEMDGLECMHRIRNSNDKPYKNIPIIALTAKAQQGDHELCIAAGANDYLSKPVNLTNLMTVLKVWLPDKEIH